MKNKTRICVIDSGVGGLCVLNECVRLLPNYDFLYIADNKNSPYGNKSKNEIDTIITNIVLKIHKATGIIFFVLACNTVTATSINVLRKMFPNLIFIGIEPAIKPSTKNNENTLVLSTVGTFKYSNLIKKYLNNSNMIFLPQKNLAKLIDDNLDNLWNIYKHLEKNFKEFTTKNIKNIVLGCTHYFFIKEQLSALFPVATFYESSQGVAKRLKDLVNNMLYNNQKLNGSFYKNLYTLSNKNTNGEIIFLTTKKDFLFKEKLKIMFNDLKSL